MLSCSEHPTPTSHLKLTPSNILHADFNPSGQLVIGTLSQVSVYSAEGDLAYLLNLPRAENSWQPIWLNADLIAIMDKAQFLLWQPTTGASSGPWQPRAATITDLFNIDGRLLLAYSDGVELLQTASSAAPGATTPEFIQFAQTSAALNEAVFASTGVMYRAYADGTIDATKVESQRRLWRRQIKAGEYLRTLAVDQHSLFVTMQMNMDPFARGRGQRVIQVDLENGQVIGESQLDIDSQAVSALADTPYLYLGGSENCLYAKHFSHAAVAQCYPRARRWGEDSGQVIALYKNADKLHAVTSSGHLQIWQKQDIVSLITDKRSEYDENDS